MNYGSLGAANAGVLALLADTTRAGQHGSGYGGHGGPFGGFSSNAVREDGNENLLNRNNEDAHFDALSSQITQFAFANQAQLNAFALAKQAQISQLALQQCECCNDNRFEMAKIETQLDCVARSGGLEVNLTVSQQTEKGLLGQIAILQNAANNNTQQGQHAEIIAILGQIAGALAGMNDGKKKKRRRHYSGFDEESNGNGENGENGECKCGCKVHVDVNSHNTDTRGGGGGVEPEVTEQPEEAVPLPTNGNGNGERVVVTEPAPPDEPVG